MLYDGKIIDFHAHIFPDKIADKATANIGGFYGITMNESGSVASLLASGGRHGVSAYIVHSTATSVSQVRSINDFIHASVTEHGEFIGYMTLHPDMAEEEIFAEIERNKERGLKGIKLHPDFQKFYADSPDVNALYAAASETDMPILIHAGDRRYDYSAPARIASVARAFPRLKIIAAHLGGYSRWSETSCYEGLDNVWFDTSSSLFFMDKSAAVAQIRKLGVGRTFFGTDYPMWRHADEIENVTSLGLSEDELERIMYCNAADFLGIR